MNSNGSLIFVLEFLIAQFEEAANHFLWWRIAIGKGHFLRG